MENNSDPILVEMHLGRGIDYSKVSITLVVKAENPKELSEFKDLIKTLFN